MDNVFRARREALWAALRPGCFVLHSLPPLIEPSAVPSGFRNRHRRANCELWPELGALVRIRFEFGTAYVTLRVNQATIQKTRRFDSASMTPSRVDTLLGFRKSFVLGQGGVFSVAADAEGHGSRHEHGVLLISSSIYMYWGLCVQGRVYGIVHLAVRGGEYIARKA